MGKRGQKVRFYWDFGKLGVNEPRNRALKDEDEDEEEEENESPALFPFSFCLFN